MMRTQAQAEASRRNGALSRGPVTPEGKARSRWNATRHGLQAERLVVMAEDEKDFEDCLEAFRDDLRPAGALEESLVERVALLHWRLRRAAWMEAGMIRDDQWKAHERQLERDKRKAGADWDLPSPRVMGIALKYSMSGPNCPYDTLGRYERRMERAIFETLRELRALRKERAEWEQAGEPREPEGPPVLPNEPERESGAVVCRVPAATTGDAAQTLKPEEPPIAPNEPERMAAFTP